MIRSIKVCVFDAYGTLFDVHAAVRRHRDAVGAQADAVSRLWRQKQLEYSWTRALMRRHADFWTVTREGLDFALAAHGLGAELAPALMEAYRDLGTFPEVPAMLRDLAARGVRCAILSNGSPAMLADAVRSAGIADLVDPVISVEEVGVYKPDPRVYAHAVERLGVTAAEIAFQSSNAWDAAAASAAGWRVVWVNRGNQPPEYQWVLNATALTDLAGLADLVAPRPA